MDDSAVRFPTGSEILLGRSEFEEFETWIWVGFELFEDGVEDFVGKFEGKLTEGVEAAQDQDSADSFEQFGFGDLGFLLQFPLERLGAVN